jgi:hypothetical protein
MGERKNRSWDTWTQQSSEFNLGVPLGQKRRNGWSDYQQKIKTRQNKHSRTTGNISKAKIKTLQNQLAQFQKQDKEVV